MISRTILLFLSRQHYLKGILATVPGFKNVTRRFIAGENIDDALSTIRELNSHGISASFDHLGESIFSEAEADAEVVEYIRVLGKIDETGINSNVSVKLTQLGLDIDESLCLNNTRRIVEAAKQRNNFVRIDMEDSPKTDATLRIFRQLRAEFDNVGIVIQSYLYRSEADIHEILKTNSRIRLVKGAYNEPAEVAFPEKKDVDDNFVKLMQVMLKSGIYHAIATQDEKMIRATKEFVAREGIAKESFEFQMLLGVRRDLQLQLSKEGWRVRTYVPYGEYWYPYFMRRLAERPANIWFVLKNLFKG